MIPLSLDEIAYVIGTDDPEAYPELKIDALSTDTRTVKRDEMFLAVKGERYNGHDFVIRAAQTGCPAVVISEPVQHIPPGCMPLMVDDTRVALGRIARHVRDVVDPLVIAVTGSNGKTTTKEMIAQILRANRPTAASPMNFNNEIGLPKALLEIEKGTRAAVVEIGSNHPGEVARLAAIARPNVGVVTRVSPTHLQGFLDEIGVAREKSALLAGLEDDGLAVINLDCPHAHIMLHATRCRTATFAIETDAEFRAEPPRQTLKGLSFRINQVDFEIPAIGAHNVTNALAAVAACCGIGIPVEACAEALRTFMPLPGRLQVIAEGDRVILDDCYNASPASMRAALEALCAVQPEREKVAILGDMLEMGENSKEYHTALGGMVVEIGVDTLWTVGDLAQEAAAEAARRGMKTKNIRCFINTADCAHAVDQAPPDAVVLVKGSRGMAMERIVAALKAAARPRIVQNPSAVGAAETGTG